MSPVIRIDDALYDRLATHRSGFETPAQVVSRVLDFYENNTDETATPPVVEAPSPPSPALELEIIFYPANQAVFLNKFLEEKTAYVRMHRTDGSVTDKVWRALKLTRDSSLEGNLRSGYLRGWKKKGIYKAEIALKPFSK